MKRKTGKRLQLFAGIVMMIILLLFTDLLICGIVVIRNNSADYHDPQEILMHLSEKNGSYQLDKKETERLLKYQQFAMLLDKNGSILWSEALPEELRKTYTLQDVAKFTRYYLEDYPVRTYVVEQGLLVIGGEKDQVWKYTFEFDVNLMTNLLKIFPLLFMFNMAVLVTVPTWIQR